VNFSSLGHNFKLKFEILRNFKLERFKFARFYCIVWNFLYVFRAFVTRGGQTFQ
jgi:hypothetical protein